MGNGVVWGRREFKAGRTRKARDMCVSEMIDASSVARRARGRDFSRFDRFSLSIIVGQPYDLALRFVLHCVQRSSSTSPLFFSFSSIFYLSPSIDLCLQFSSVTTAPGWQRYSGFDPAISVTITCRRGGRPVAAGWPETVEWDGG